MREYLTAREFKNRTQQRRYVRELMRSRAKRVAARTPGIGSKVVPQKAMSYLDTIYEEPERRSLRIYFQNINTLKLGSEAGEDLHALKKLSATGVSIMCLGELNKNMEKKEVRKEVESLLRESMPGAKYCAGGNQDFVTEAKRKQGGLAIITKKHMNKYVKGRRVDQKGRWASTEVWTEGVKLVIYNLYVPLREDGGGQQQFDDNYRTR